MSSIIKIAKKYIGSRSVKYTDPDSGNTLKGFDCSGFIQFVLKEAGFPLIHGSKASKLRHSEEFFDFMGYSVHSRARRSGDLIFFSRNGTRPTHVGIYLGDDFFIHSPGKDNSEVKIISVKGFCKRNLLKFNPDGKYPQIYFENPIGYKRISSVYVGRFQTSI